MDLRCVVLPGAVPLRLGPGGLFPRRLLLFGGIRLRAGEDFCAVFLSPETVIGSHLRRGDSEVVLAIVIGSGTALAAMAAVHNLPGLGRSVVVDENESSEQ